MTVRLLELQPDSPQRYRQRLALLAERGDNAAIEAHLRATIAKFPEDGQTKGDLVRFYLSQKQPDKAEAFLREEVCATALRKDQSLCDELLFLIPSVL